MKAYLFATLLATELPGTVLHSSSQARTVVRSRVSSKSCGQGGLHVVFIRFDVEDVESYPVRCGSEQKPLHNEQHICIFCQFTRDKC